MSLIAGALVLIGGGKVVETVKNSVEIVDRLGNVAKDIQEPNYMKHDLSLNLTKSILQTNSLMKLENNTKTNINASNKDVIEKLLYALINAKNVK